MLHSNRIYPKLFIILFSNSWWLLSAAFFWNTMLVIILCKILHRDFTTTIYENFTSVFLFIQGKRKVESWKLHSCFTWSIERVKAVLRYVYWIMFWKMKIVTKIQNIMFVESYNIKAYSNIHNQTVTQKILFWVPVNFF